MAAQSLTLAAQHRSARHKSFAEQAQYTYVLYCFPSDQAVIQDLQKDSQQEAASSEAHAMELEQSIAKIQVQIFHHCKGLHDKVPGMGSLPADSHAMVSCSMAHRHICFDHHHQATR